MLRNFVTQQDLLKLFPQLTDELAPDQSDLSNQISEAFQQVLIEFNNKGINTRLMQTPFDLGSSTGNAFPQTSIETTSTTGSSQKGDRDYHRLVFNVTSLSGSWEVKIQGSNDNSTWEDVVGASITASEVGEQTVTFDGQYTYWRYVTTPISAGSITFQRYLLETQTDKLTMYRTISLQAFPSIRVQNDPFHLRVQRFDKLFDDLMTSVKFYYDSDESGKIEEGEEPTNTIHYFIV